MISFRQTLKDIKSDIRAPKLNLKFFFSNYFFNPSFRVLLNHRLGKYFIGSGFIIFRLLGSYYRYRLITKRSCDISYRAKIGKFLRLPHPIGIVIGDGVVIKDDVMIFQQVTIGSHGKRGLEFAYPVIENKVKIFPGAKIIGGVTIGENAIIGANSVVNRDVPAYATAVGIPCRIIEGKNLSALI